MKNKKIRTVSVNDRGQIVIPEDMRRGVGIASNDTLILIEGDGEIIMRKESDVLKALSEDKFWEELSRESLKGMWNAKDKVWDSIARKDING